MEKYNLTTPQQNVWNMAKIYPDSPITYLAGEAVINNYSYNYDIVNESLNNVIATNDAYRIKLVEEDGNTYQVFVPFEYKEHEVFDISDMTDEQQQKFISEFAMKKLPENELTDFKIVKHSQAKYSVYWKISHMIGDAYTAGLFSQQISENVYKLSNGENLDYTEKASYKTLIDREVKYKESERFTKDKEAFSAEYKEPPTYTSIACKKSSSIDAKRYLEHLSTDDTELIKNFCHQYKISEAVFFETIIMMYINKVTNSEQVTIGSPVLNRTGALERKISGMFISTSPLKVDFSKESTFLALAEEIKKQKMNLFRRQTYPFQELQNDLYENFGYSGKLFDIVVSYQNAKTFKQDFIDVTSDWHFTNASNDELVISIDERDNSGFKLSFDYKTECFDESEISNISTRMNSLIKQVIKEPDISINNYNLFTEADYVNLNKFNNSPKSDIGANFVEIFEQNVLKNPDVTALQVDGKTYTYKTLNQMANAIANELLNHDIKSDIVPIVGGRDVYAIASLIAIRKINKAYFILDDTLYTEDKLAKLIEDSGASLILKYNSSYKLAKGIEVDVTKVDFTNIEFETSKDLLEEFCVIHTSGSTGEPKLVVLTDEGVVNMAQNNAYLVEGSQSVVNLVSMSFDAFLMNTMMALMNNKKLILTTNEEMQSPILIEALLGEEEKCAIMQTPSRMRQFLKNATTDNYKNVNNIIMGAELIGDDILKLIKEKCPNANIYNSYGPTETTVFNTVKKIDGTTTIGNPIPNFEVYVVDKNEKILPPNVIGQICAVGTGVAKGYLNNEEETKKKFFTTSSGMRGYFTGDYGYIDSANELNFIGREDNQIKINGIRIEIEEIEAAMCNLPEITSAAIKVQEGESGKFICAFYESQIELSECELRTKLASSIPYNMIPQIFVKVAKMPYTPSLKIDKKKLPNVDLKKILQDNFVEPVTDLEKQICEIWEEILKVSPVGINNTFTSLGGTSFIMIDVMTRIEQITKRSCNPAMFAKNPTVFDMCQVLENKKSYTNIDLNYDYDIPINSNNDNKNVLLTGANGYLGSHILEYLLKTDTCDIYCIIRDEEKFKTALEFYFGDLYSKYEDRIKIINGDIGQECLGMKSHHYNFAKSNVGKIINCAANVSHFSSIEDAKKVNVDGVYNLLKLAVISGASFEHLSTLTISGINVSNQSRENTVFTEDSLDIGQDPTHDAYILSKYKAEELINSFSEVGIPCSIYRTGYISNRSYDNKFQINKDTSAFKMIVRIIEEIKIFPASGLDIKVQMAAVDKVAEAVVKLSNSTRKRTYHLYDPKVDNLADFLNQSGIKFEVLPDEEFMRRAELLLAKSDSEEHQVVYRYLSSFINNLTTNSISNVETMEQLEQEGFSY